MKIVHIHSDRKFLSHVLKYEAEDFRNSLIILGDKDFSSQKYHDSATFVKPEDENIDLIKTLCEDADLVVLTSLNHFKCKIALALPSETKIAWRFFGHELYSRKKKKVLSEKTQLIIESVIPRVSVIFKIKRVIRKYFPKKDIFSSAVNRIDFFFGVYKEEYENLKKEWPNLPQFVSILIGPGEVLPQHTNKEPYLILGNSRNEYNNHIDLIDIIKKSKNPFNYRAMLFFSYGKVNHYSETIENSIKNKAEFELINHFLDMSEFENVYRKASAFVLNGYRQMALGNIFTALRYGVKVYLSEKNDTLLWLRNNGFILYTVDDFARDYVDGKLVLKEKEALHNIDCLNILYANNSVELFHDKLRTLLDNKEA